MSIRTRWLACIRIRRVCPLPGDGTRSAFPPLSPFRPAARAWPPLTITLAIQALASAAVIAPTAVAPVINAELGLPTAAVGIYIALVYLGAMVASVLGSHVVTRHGAIRTSQYALGACALGLVLIASGQMPLALLGALVLGLGYGPITPASSQILARATPAHRMGLVFSLKQTGVPLGGVLAGLAGPPLTLATGWPVALSIFALAALLCAAIAQRLRTALDADRPATFAWPGAAALLRPVRMVWAARELRTLAACSFVFSALQVCLTAYAVSWLTSDLGWALVAAGVALSVSQSAGVVGRVLWGWIADRGPGARRMLALLCVMMIASALLAPWLDPGTAPPLVLLALALFGATAIGWNGIYLAAVARLVPAGQAAAATGGTLAFTYLGVVLGPPLFGLVAARAQSHGIAFAATALPLGLCLVALWRSGR